MIKEILSNLTIVSILTVICSFALVYYLIPKIIFMVNYHDLGKRPSDRCSHVQKTPSMGGFAFFVTLIVSIFFFKYFDVDGVGLNFVASVTIIFIIGLKDDLVHSTAKDKVLSEIAAITIMFFFTGFHISSFEGFLGIYEVPQILVGIIHLLITLTIINAYNLIDGVDGLASTIGISIFSMFGLIFYGLELHFYLLICLSFIGTLFAYLRFNFSPKIKVFMGDTGSLIIGFSIAILSLKFLTLEPSSFENFNFKTENKLFIIAAILIVPLIDLFRVIIIRLLQGKNPFRADRNHIHHILLDLGLPHYAIALLLGLLNYVLAFLLIYLSLFFNSFEMMLIVIVVFSIIMGVLYKLKKQIITEINSA